MVDIKYDDMGRPETQRPDVPNNKVKWVAIGFGEILGRIKSSIVPPPNQMWAEVESGVRAVYLGVDKWYLELAGCTKVGYKFCAAIAEIDDPEAKYCSFENETVNEIGRQMGYTDPDDEYPEYFNLYPPTFSYEGESVTVKLEVAEQLIQEYYDQQMALVAECKAKLNRASLLGT